MARQTEITIGAFSFAVHKQERQEADSNGRGLFLRSGEPKMVDTWMIDIIEVLPGGGVTVTHLPLVEAAKDELVRQLTGGVLVATTVPSPEIARAL